MKKLTKNLSCFLLVGFLFVPLKPLMDEAIPPLTGATVGVGFASGGLYLLHKRPAGQEHSFTTKNVGGSIAIVLGSAFAGWLLNKFLFDYTPTGKFKRVQELFEKLIGLMPRLDHSDRIRGFKALSQLLENILTETDEKEKYEDLKKRSLETYALLLKHFYTFVENNHKTLLENRALKAVLTNVDSRMSDQALLNTVANAYNDDAWIVLAMHDFSHADCILSQASELLGCMLQITTRTDDELTTILAQSKTLSQRLQPCKEVVHRLSVLLKYCYDYHEAELVFNELKAHPRMARFCSQRYGQEQDFIAAVKGLYTGQRWYEKAKEEFSRQRGKIANALNKISRLSNLNITLDMLQDVSGLKNELQALSTTFTQHYQLLGKVAACTRAQEKVDHILAHVKVAQLLEQEYDTLTDGALWDWGKREYRTLFSDNYDWYKKLADDLKKVRDSLLPLQRELGRVIGQPPIGQTDQRCKEIKRIVDRMVQSSRNKYEFAHSYGEYRNIKQRFESFLQTSSLRTVLIQNQNGFFQPGLISSLSRIYSAQAWPLIKAEEELKEAMCVLAQFARDVSRIKERCSCGRAVKINNLEDRVRDVQNCLVDHLTTVRRSSEYQQEVRQQQEYQRQQQQRREEERRREQERRRAEEQRRREQAQQQVQQNALQAGNDAAVQQEREQNEDDPCMICLEGYASVDNIVILNCCGNVMHQNCYNDLTNAGHNRCPTCRGDMSIRQRTTFGAYQR